MDDDGPRENTKNVNIRVKIQFLTFDYARKHYKNIIVDSNSLGNLSQLVI